MNFRLSIAPLSILIATSSVTAQEQAAKVLLEQSNFKVTEHAVSDQDSHERGMCLAKIASGPKLSMTFIGYQDESFTMRLKDDDWQLEDRATKIVVQVDKSKWSVHADALKDGNVVLANFDYAATAKHFVNTVSDGHNLTVSTESGTELGKFVLTGASEVMAVFSECWSRVQVPVKVLDPFAKEATADSAAKTATKDPFAAKPAVVQPSDENFEYTSRDSAGVTFSVKVAKAGTTPNGVNGAVFISTNKSGRDHESFGMYDDCTAFSLRKGWGNWSWSNGGFIVEFSGQDGYSFPRGETHPVLGGGCKM